MADFAGLYLRPGAVRPSPSPALVERSRQSVTAIRPRGASFLPDAASLPAFAASAPLGGPPGAPRATLAVAWRPEEAVPGHGEGEVAVAADGSALFLTGRIDNADELPGRGSTAERLLELYRAQGPPAFAVLDGPFACILLDGRDGSLVLARGRFGLHAVFFREEKEEISFAARAEAFAAPGIETDLEALLDLLDFQVLPGDRTLFRDVRRLPPAHALVFGARSRRFVRYWTPPAVDGQAADRLATDARAARRTRRQIRELLEVSVARAVRGLAEPYGLFLSGGLDSSLIAALAGRARPRPLCAFTGAYEDGPAYDERAFARAAAERAKLPLREVLIRPADFADHFLRMLHDLGEPGGGPGLIGQYVLAESASREVSLALNGEGGDELFGGYARLAILAAWEAQLAGAGPRAALPAASPAVPPVPAGYEELARRVLAGAEVLSEEEIYFRLNARAGAGGAEQFLALAQRDELRRRGVPKAEERFRARYRAAAAGAGDGAGAADRALRYELACNLPVVLAVDTRTAAAWGMTVVSPFLAAPLAEMILGLGTRATWTGARLKGLLFEVARDLLPPAVLERRDKQGFPTPFVRWARAPRDDPDREPARTLIRELLLGERTRRRGLFQSTAVERALAAAGEFDRALWGLAVVEAWHRIWIDGEGR